MINHIKKMKRFYNTKLKKFALAAIGDSKNLKNLKLTRLL